MPVLETPRGDMPPPMRCLRCNGLGHLARACKRPRTVPAPEVAGGSRQRRRLGPQAGRRLQPPALVSPAESGGAVLVPSAGTPVGRGHRCRRERRRRRPQEGTNAPSTDAAADLVVPASGTCLPWVDPLTLLVWHHDVLPVRDATDDPMLEEFVASIAPSRFDPQLAVLEEPSGVGVPAGGSLLPAQLCAGPSRSAASSDEEHSDHTTMPSRVTSPSMALSPMGATTAVAPAPESLSAISQYLQS